MSTTPVRHDSGEVEIARLAATTQGRSVAAQLAHWARIGRELESAPTTSVRDINEVLAGHRSYDTLTGSEQAIVRARWAEGLEARLEGADLHAQFAAAGHDYATLDRDGNVVVIRAGDEPSNQDRPTDRALEALRDVLAATRSATGRT